jgi:hypothetical protein
MILKSAHLFVTLGLLITLGMTFEQQAHAYVDPGSSLFLFQSLGAMFTGALFYFRKHLRALIGKTKSVEPGSEGDSE